MKYIDSLLSKITMYRVVLYLLVFLFLLSTILSFFKILPYDPFQMLLNSVVIIFSCWFSNFIFSKFFKAVVNVESVYITAFILCLISPIQFQLPVWIFALTSAIAMGSKYILAVNKRHIFNPAAIAVFVIGIIFADFAATWWVGNKILFIPVAIASILVVLKTRRGTMVLTFLGVYLALTLLILLSQGSSISLLTQSLFTTVTQSALIFFACIMLTEPRTSPATKKLQIFYSALVAILFALSLLQLPGIVITAEISLLFGNIFFFIFGPKYRFSLPILKTSKITADLYTFEFKKPANFNFIPGQYMEWTLNHKNMDTRGNRRFFSLASSPTEDNIMISYRLYNPSSSFKNALTNLSLNKQIVAGNLSGDFVLPKNLNQPLAFLAGGIGITPFRSMVKYITDKKIQANIILLFVAKKKEDFVFSDVFKKGESYGVKTVCVLADYHSFNSHTIDKNIPDYKSRSFYISGPQPMVKNYESILKQMKVKKIKTDFFPGYAEK